MLLGSRRERETTWRVVTVVETCAVPLAVPNTRWADAGMGGGPRAGVRRGMDGRGEAVMTTFNSQEVANALWAYATIGREPCAGGLRGSEGRAEAVKSTFKS